MALDVGTRRPGGSGQFDFGYAVASPGNGADDSPAGFGMEK